MAAKRSTHVSAPLLASAALAVLTTGCHQHEPQRCVDENNRVVDPSFCANAPKPGGTNNNYGNPGFWPYHFYYGGSGGFAPGTIVSGGSLTPLAGHSYSTTTRGGFGSSFGGHGSDSSSGHAASSGHAGGSGGE